MTRIFQIVWRTEGTGTYLYRVFISELTHAIAINAGDLKMLQKIRNELQHALAYCDNKIAKLSVYGRA